MLRKSQEGVGSEFCRRIGGDPKVGGMDFNRGGSTVFLATKFKFITCHIISCHIQSFLFMIDALCLITDILGQKPIAGNRRCL